MSHNTFMIEDPTRSGALSCSEDPATATMPRPAAAEGTPTRAEPEKKRKPDTPNEAQPKKPKASTDAKNKPRMPTDGEKVYYRGAIVEEFTRARSSSLDLTWRIKFPSGTIESRAKVTVFMCTYMCIYMMVASRLRQLSHRSNLGLNC